MMKRLHKDESGAGLIEFALAAPAILMFVIGIAQLGMLCMADAGLRAAVAEGARTASIYRVPAPDDAALDAIILARIDEAGWGMADEHKGEPEIARGEDDECRDYIEISMSYTAPLDFIFLELPSVTLTETRRVYTQEQNCSTSSSSSTSSGGSTSASSTSSGASTSTSSTSTSSTSASTSSTSTSSTSSGNGNGNGHGHGNGNGNGH